MPPDSWLVRGNKKCMYMPEGTLAIGDKWRLKKYVYNYIFQRFCNVQVALLIKGHSVMQEV